MNQRDAWPFKDSPMFALMLDESLVCRELTAPWRDRLAPHLAERSEVPATELFGVGADSALLDQLNGVFRTGAAIADFAIELLLADGNRPGRLHAWHGGSADGGRPFLIALATEIGESPQSAGALSQLQKRYQIILDAAGEGIYGLDRDGRITFGNAAAERILGWRDENVLGQRSHDVHHHSYPDGSPYPRDQCPIYAALKDGEVHRVDNEVFWHASGAAVPVEYTSTPILIDGKPDGAVVVFRDITQRKEFERQREVAFEEIRNLNDQLELERDYLRDEISIIGDFGDIIGESRALKRTLAQITAVAQTPVSVLILGESGVGKEMVARAIHMKSSRASRPLVKINCASIPKDLFESEFFGHVRGAFTGAHKDRIGRFQLADHGTLFLDEVGEIPLSQQGKLLRALQEGEFERVGDDATIKVDVRVIAATNRDLMDEIKAERFREDLYYRISVFPVEVPPLRDRVDDIAPLALHFLKTICRELGREPPRLTKEQLSELKRQPWPGNIRELKNVIERAVISSSGSHLRLDRALPQSASTRSASAKVEQSADAADFVTAEEFRELEKSNLTAALRHANWKVWGPGGAADLLGIKPSTLTYQMKGLGIVKESVAK